MHGHGRMADIHRTTGARQLTFPAHASPNDVIVRLVLSVGDATDANEPTQLQSNEVEGIQTNTRSISAHSWMDNNLRESSIRNKQFN
jgi:hypothetical protein